MSCVDAFARVPRKTLFHKDLTDRRGLQRSADSFLEGDDDVGDDGDDDADDAAHDDVDQLILHLDSPDSQTVQSWGNPPMDPSHNPGKSCPG